jgi:hypothetical protein
MVNDNVLDKLLNDLLKSNGESEPVVTEIKITSNVYGVKQAQRDAAWERRMAKKYPHLVGGAK